MGLWLRLAHALGISLVAVGLASLVARLPREPASPAALPFAGMAAALLLAGLAWAGAVALGGVPPGQRLGLGRGRLRALGLALAVLGTLAASFGADTALRWLELRDTGSLARLDRAVAGASTPPSLLVVLLGIGLAPALGEELLFRGLLQRGLARRLRPSLAILVASIAFGAVHGDLAHAAVAFLLGLYLGVVAQLANGVRATMLCHALNNLWAIGTNAVGLAGAPLPLWTLPLAFAASGALLLGAARFRREETPGSVRQADGQLVPHSEEHGQEEEPQGQG